MLTFLPGVGQLAHWRSSSLLLATAVAVALLTLGANAQQADALCVNQKEYGRWVNSDRNTSGITTIQLTSRDDCNPNMRVWGKCTPKNCYWGSVPARRVNSKLYGYYDHGFAKRRVYAKLSAHRPGQLWVYWVTDFVDPGRADYTKQEWFVRR